MIVARWMGRSNRWTVGVRRARSKHSRGAKWVLLNIDKMTTTTAKEMQREDVTVDDNDGDGAVTCLDKDGRHTFVYALTNEWGRSWIGAPLPFVLKRIQADSRGAVRFNVCRAYKHARVKTTGARYHGFRVDRRRKDSVDWSRLRHATDTVVCLPEPPPPPPPKVKKQRVVDRGLVVVDEGPRFGWGDEDGSVAMAA